MHLLVPFLVPPAIVAVIAGLALSGPTPSVTTAAVPHAGSRPRAAAATARPRSAAATGTGTTTIAGAYTTPPTTAIGGPSRGVLGWPLSPRPAVYRRFEQPPTKYSQGHRGVDLIAVVSQPVLSAAEGVVAFSGVIAGRGVITIQHSGRLRTSYEPVDARLTSGAVVHRGATIGVVSAAAGHCMPLTCLHWGAIVGQTYQDPLSLLGFGRPILLPLG